MGKRELKREETLQRITQTGMRLFLERGYDETTLDDIAEAAGIARRTFFYYFKSKEDVLHHYQGASGFVAALGPAMLQEDPAQKPMDAVRHCLLKLVSQYESSQSIQIDKLMRSTESLRVRKQAMYVEMEDTILSALYHLWPQPERRASLRMVAMIAVSLLRSTQEEWRQGGGQRSITEHLKESFQTLERELG